METHVISIQQEKDKCAELQSAAQALANGKLVVFPTETVYGLGANALDDGAVSRIFEAKGRPSDNPLIVHIATKEQLAPLVSHIPAKAIILMEAFWPGPLTLVFKKSDQVPEAVTAGLSTVAVRMPDNAVALNLIHFSGVPVAAPSANTSGKPSPTLVEHVLTDLMGRVEYIIDGGPCRVGLESTVLDVTCDPPLILRPGGVTREMLERTIGKVDQDWHHELKEGDKPKSPGMKYRHYAPEADMFLVTGDEKRVIERISRLVAEAGARGQKTGVLACHERKDAYAADMVLCPGSSQCMEDLASGIYACLRQFDEAHVDIIFAEGFPEEGIGQAVMNRLKKAASGKILQV